MASLPDRVRAACAEIAASARWVTIDLAAAPVQRRDRRPRPGAPPARAGARGAGPLRARARRRELRAGDVGAVAGLPPGHELTGLHARALRELGAWLGDRTALDAVDAAGGSAARLAEQLVDGLPLMADPGFAKRAQITANDLVLAGVASFADVDGLTVFADNLLPHVLRVDGVLEVDAALAARIDAGEWLAHGSREEVELRACAVHACEGLAARAGCRRACSTTGSGTAGSSRVTPRPDGRTGRAPPPTRTA